MTYQPHQSEDRTLQQAMEEAWRSPAEQPEWILIGGVLHRTMRGELARLEALDRICSPAGLRSIFPWVR